MELQLQIINIDTTLFVPYQPLCLIALRRSCSLTSPCNILCTRSMFPHRFATHLSCSCGELGNFLLIQLEYPLQRLDWQNRLVVNCISDIQYL